MTKEEIIITLEEKHRELFDLILKEAEDFWMKAPEGKWTVGQHILHLVNATKLLNKALSYPKFILKYKFGKANRATRTYEAVAKRYQERLSQNLERARTFNQDLRVPALSEKTTLISQLEIENKKFQAKTSKWKDKQLDTLLIPHPLMGKMIVREIIMWSAYHTEHHTNIIKEHYL